MPKEFPVKITRAEIDHIVWALSHAAEECYYGPKEQYMNRYNRIVAKLEGAIK